MILGAGVYQVPLIRRAKMRGLKTLVVSVKGNYPGFRFADDILYLDTRDVESIVDAAVQEDICAVVTTGTDVAVPALGAVAEALGLPGISRASGLMASNKVMMKEAFIKGGVKTSDYCVVNDLNEALKAADKIGYPVIVKVPDKSGSRGITRVNGPEDINDAWAYAMAATDSESIIVERFINGEEFGVDAVIQNGNICAVIPHEKNVHFSQRTGVPEGHLCPTAFSEQIRQRIYTETQKVTMALGVDDCVVNIDAIMQPDGEIYVIEAAARCGGTGIPEVIGGSLGINWYDVILDLALGIEVPGFTQDRIHNPPFAAVSRMLISDREGMFDKMIYEVDGHVYSNEDYSGKDIQVSVNVVPGEIIRRFDNGTERIGQAVFLGNSRDEVMGMCERFMKTVKIFTKEE